ncbi:hypothetical protein D9613_001899 [Agrocybe pediades]|uniref:Major facilitator superfamily (MFS) profile domain-containing protein n=1 Tax=Agrocybe pediades TaxID=84607 RepID=A0A8H4R7J9_9AGAR|nr:hypothetical protein D9613_001899 [Agrocybe pediades]
MSIANKKRTQVHFTPTPHVMDGSPTKAYDQDKKSNSEQVIATPAANDASLSRKQRLSPYFTIAAAGFGLVSDGYQNNLMTMANVVFKKLYPQEYTPDVSTRVSNSLLVGAIIGQVVVGLVCDRIGRKAALVITTSLIVIGATLATAAHGAGGSASGLFWFLTFARGLTGIVSGPMSTLGSLKLMGQGVGGEYPASSTSASESANEKSIKSRGPVFIMVTNFVLSFGGPLAVSVFLIVLSAAGERHLQTVWRMITSKLFRNGAIKQQVPYWLVIKRYWKSLLGTSGAWFLYDFVTFPNGVFSGTIISSVIHDGDIKRTAEWQLLLGAIALPGVFVGAMLCNPLGRRNTMMLGFSGYLVFGLIIGLAYDRITKIIPLFVIFYGLMQSFGNLGPGDMLGLVSAESFPTAIRAFRGTCYGLSAAVGKTGAAVGTQAFTPIQLHLGKKWTFIIAAICGITGIIVTYLFVPDMTGIDLAEEDEKFEKYLAENGWTGAVGEDSASESELETKEKVVY